MNTIVKMFEMQEELNTFIAGKNWKKFITSSGQEINFLRCIRFEMTEAIDQSFQWKHWKNNDKFKQYSVVDSHNLKVEFVDSYHFLMSEILTNKKYTTYCKKYNFNKIKPSKLQDKEIILMIENYIREVYDYEYDKVDFKLLNLFINFWKLTLSVMSMEEFYKLYITKNALNLFRLKHGYQDGTYIKIWNGVEDNEYLNSYLKNNEEITYEGIYSYLETEYQKIGE